MAGFSFLGKFPRRAENNKAKIRIVIPYQFRERFGEKVFIQLVFGEDHLVVSLDGNTGLATRVVSVEIGSRGRISIPNFLARAAGLGADLVVVGCGTYLEIWPATEWQKELQMINMIMERRRK